MSYTLRLTNGKILLTLADQQKDNLSTSLTLIGKNVNAYGSDLNDNFVRLLENFSYSSPPTSPLVGQLWFHSVEQRMYVCNNSLQFKPVGGPILSPVMPADLVTGDFWIDTTKTQLNYYDGANLVTVGPGYDSTQGKSGVIVETIQDQSANTQIVSGIYSNNELLGVISNTAFAVNTYSSYFTQSGITNIFDGITAAPGIKFYGTATSTDSFQNIQSSQLILNSVSTPQVLQSQLNVFNDSGITVGLQEDLAVYVAGANRVVTMALADQQDFTLIGQTATNATVNVLYYSSSTGALGIFNTTPSYPVDITGNVRISGNLIINGSLYDISSNVVTTSTSYTETATAGQKIVIVNGSPVTVTLPTAVGNTAYLTYKFAVTGTMTISAQFGQTIDGLVSTSTSIRYTAITIVSDGANWWKIS